MSRAQPCNRHSIASYLQATYRQCQRLSTIIADRQRTVGMERSRCSLLTLGVLGEAVVDRPPRPLPRPRPRDGVAGDAAGRPRPRRLTGVRSYSSSEESSSSSSLQGALAARPRPRPLRRPPLRGVTTSSSSSESVARDRRRRLAPAASAANSRRAGGRPDGRPPAPGDSSSATVGRLGWRQSERRAERGVPRPVDGETAGGAEPRRADRAAGVGVVVREVSGS